MDKHFTPQSVAISASPNIVTPLLNESGKLEKITSVVVLYIDQDAFDLYRRSTKVQGSWSRETYKLSTKRRISKDKQKYPAPPIVPDGAYSYRLSNIEFSAMTELSSSFLENFVKDFNLR